MMMSIRADRYAMMMRRCKMLTEPVVQADSD